MKAEVVNYVLKKPSAEHRDAISKASEQSLKAVAHMLTGDMDKALAVIHAQPPRPKPPRPANLLPKPESEPEPGDQS